MRSGRSWSRCSRSGRSLGGRRCTSWWPTSHSVNFYAVTALDRTGATDQRRSGGTPRSNVATSCYPSSRGFWHRTAGDSQAQSASSILVPHFVAEPQVPNLGLRRRPDRFGHCAAPPHHPPPHHAILRPRCRVRRSAKPGRPTFASRAMASAIVTDGLRFSPTSLTTVSATSCGNSRCSPHRYESGSTTLTPRAASSPAGKSARFQVINVLAPAATTAAAWCRSSGSSPGISSTRCRSPLP